MEVRCFEKKGGRDRRGSGYPHRDWVAEAWKNICEGKSGIGPLTRFDAKDFETRIAGQVKEFTPERYIEKKEIKKMDLFIQYALAAAKEAMEDAQLKITPENSEQIGVIVGRGWVDSRRSRKPTRFFSKKAQAASLPSSFQN